MYIISISKPDNKGVNFYNHLLIVMPFLTCMNSFCGKNEDFLKNVVNQTVLVTVGFHCMKKKTPFHKI